MSAPTANPTAYREHMINHAVNVIGSSLEKLAVFTAIYRGKSKIKSQERIRQEARLKTTKRVLELGKPLVREDIIKQVKVDGRVAYEKLDFYANNKKTVIARAKKNMAGKIVITPNAQSGILEVHLRVSSLTGKAEKITVNDIDSFKKVNKVKNASQTRYAESDMKERLKQIITEYGKFQDWGGETNDIYTNRLVFKGRRCATAFALKGRSTLPPLTPKKMGKNGDQITRLFRSAAEVFLVVYDAQIDQSIVEQMETAAENKANSKGRTIYYGIIDGQDLARLFAAYPDNK